MLYHGTSARRLDSIQATGLDPSHGTGPKIVFLTPDFDVASRFAATRAGIEHSGGVVLAIPGALPARCPVPNRYRDLGYVGSPHVVAPDLFTVVARVPAVPFDLQMLVDGMGGLQSQTTSAVAAIGALTEALRRR